MEHMAGHHEGRPETAETRYRTPDERRARGKALRQEVPRREHGT